MMASMKLTVEISMYPLHEDFVPRIRAFIERLNSYTDIEVTTFPTATIMVGDYDVVMDALKDALHWSQQQFGRTVFVTKFITDYEAH
jgi:uncharacterized protein YqgV (UPF0045/DUF77 family)